MTMTDELRQKLKELEVGQTVWITRDIYTGKLIKPYQTEITYADNENNYFHVAAFPEIDDEEKPWLDFYGVSYHRINIFDNELRAWKSYVRDIEWLLEDLIRKINFNGYDRYE